MYIIIYIYMYIIIYIYIYIYIIIYSFNPIQDDFSHWTCGKIMKHRLKVTGGFNDVQPMDVQGES